MNKDAIIHFLKKYKKISTTLNSLDSQNFSDALNSLNSLLKSMNLSEDEHSFDEIISFVNTALNDEEVFHTITTNDETDLSKYNINQEIIKNKMDIPAYWRKLDMDGKKKLKVLELNILRYLLNKKNCDYLKGKKKIIQEIDYFVREKVNSDSYEQIVV
jgi:hypothetical protein